MADWTDEVSGTSEAAASVTSMIAHFRNEDDEFCVPGGPSWGMTIVDLVRSEDIPAGTTTYRPGEPKPMSQPMAYNEPTDPAFPRKGQPIVEPILNVGDRLRATISWEVCATDPQSGSTAATGIDFDLLLYNTANSKYVYGSQSIHDNNEGFDVTISASDGAGSYQLFIAWPDGATDCGGATSTEVGYAVKWGVW